MNLAERQQGLLKLVEDYREQECRRLLDAARQEASALLRETYRREMGQLHRRVVAERSRAQSVIQAARAERATRERRTSEHLNLDQLESAWPLLRERLLARWRVPEQRQRWAARYLRRALDLLPRSHWMVRHAPEWREPERQAMAEDLAKHLGQAPRFQSEGRIEAGLIVESGGAVLDASLAGLLQDRARLEARLLALLGATEAAP